ncbi:MAG: NAD(P)-dependent oxidoreductase [Acidobacteria bacterium]|nr:NAD(P)-dependent oxidoreductase [Acidobacteriota bacterium]
MSSSERLGFIGLGIMGFPMAENLIKAGYPLTVYNRTRSRAEELAGFSPPRRGAVVADTPAEVGRQAQVIFLCVGDSAAVLEIAENLLPGIQPGSLVVDCSTISPSVSRQVAGRFRERGVDFLDAPCSGSKAGATNATLTFMVGGAPQAFERAKPYLQVMGKKAFYVGGPGMGLQAKLTQNLIGALTVQAMAEGFVLARKAGLPPSLMLEVLEASVARSPIIAAKMPMVMKRNFEPNFSLKWMHKDLGLMLESGRELNVPLPATALAHELFGASVAMGHGEEDFASAITLLETLAGVEVTD